MEKLGARRRQQDDRSARIPCHALEEVEQVVFGPVDVLDERDRRSFFGKLLDECDDGLVQTLTGIERMEVAGGIRAKRKSQDLPVAEDACNLLRRCALEDPEVLLENLSDGPVRDPVAVRQAAPGPPERRRLLPRENLPQLPDESRLADARLPDDGHEMRLVLRDGPEEGRPQELQLGIPAHEHASEAGGAPGTSEGQRTEDPPADDAFGLPFRLDGALVSELESSSDRCHRAFTGEHLPRCSGLLQTGADVDGVPRHEGAALAGHSYDDVACIYSDPQLELVPEELDQPTLHRERGVQGTLRVILLGRRGAECGHDRVAGELLHGPSGALDLLRHGGVEPVEADANALRVLRVGPRSRADEIGKEHGRQLPLVDSGAPGLDRRTTRRAEAGIAGYRGAA